MARLLSQVFDPSGLAAVDPHADEATLIARIAELERAKSAAAAGQARAATALDAARCPRHPRVRFHAR